MITTLTMLLKMSLISLNPGWVDKTPEDSNNIYVVGESVQTKSKEEALEKAWNSALIRIGTSEFPELIQLSSKSTETLKSAEFERTSIQNFQLINWKGIKEVKMLGSPFTTYDLKTETYTSYRLLSWSKKDMETSKRETSEALAKLKVGAGSVVKTYKVPTTPEQAQLEELAMSNALDQIRSIQNQIQSKDEKISQVMNGIVCGMKLSDLYKVLGKPDYEDMWGVGWGTYRVDNHVTSITEGSGHGKTKFVCNN